MNIGKIFRKKSTSDGLIEDNYLQKSRQAEMNYPYIVIRRFAAVYQNVPVEFVRDDTEKAYPHALTIIDPKAYISGKLTEQARKAIIGITMHLVKTKGLRACAVFSEADGSMNQSNNPPSCNINYEKLMNS